MLTENAHFNLHRGGNRHPKRLRPTKKTADSNSPKLISDYADADTALITPWPTS